MGDYPLSDKIHVSNKTNDHRISTDVRNLMVFEDTFSQCLSDNCILESILASRKNFKLYKNPIEVVRISAQEKKNNVLILNGTSLESVDLIDKISVSKTALLDFASATTPGGGVLIGSKGQEEDICRLTSLYFTLNSDELKRCYYFPNANTTDPEKDTLLKDSTVIYIPEVKVIKDCSGKRLNKSNYQEISVIVCAAPNLRHCSPPNQKLLESCIYERACQILRCAIKNDCKNIVLGAHGCGAFRNPVDIVAKSYYRAVSEYGNDFENVVFSIPDEDKAAVFDQCDFARNDMLEKTMNKIISLRKEYCLFESQRSSSNSSACDSEFQNFLLEVSRVKQLIENLEILSANARKNLASYLLPIESLWIDN